MYLLASYYRLNCPSLSETERKRERETLKSQLSSISECDLI